MTTAAGVIGSLLEKYSSLQQHLDDTRNQRQQVLKATEEAHAERRELHEQGQCWRRHIHDLHKSNQPDQAEVLEQQLMDQQNKYSELVAEKERQQQQLRSFQKILPNYRAQFLASHRALGIRQLVASINSSKDDDNSLLSLPLLAHLCFLQNASSFSERDAAQEMQLARLLKQAEDEYLKQENRASDGIDKENKLQRQVTELQDALTKTQSREAALKSRQAQISEASRKHQSQTEKLRTQLDRIQQDCQGLETQLTTLKEDTNEAQILSKRYKEDVEYRRQGRWYGVTPQQQHGLATPSKVAAVAVENPYTKSLRSSSVASEQANRKNTSSHSKQNHGRNLHSTAGDKRSNPGVSSTFAHRVEDGHSRHNKRHRQHGGHLEFGLAALPDGDISGKETTGDGDEDDDELLSFAPFRD